MKLQFRFVARSIAIAFFMAVLGFSYAVVTQADNSAASSRAVSPRVVGTQTKRFLNAAYTPIPTDFDIGDACFGSFISRYVTATGGLRPYVFSASGLSGVKVLDSGRFTGDAPTPGGLAQSMFTVTVADSTQTNITGPAPVATTSTFHIEYFNSGSQLFRFAVDHLNDGVLGQAYISKVDTISGKGVVTYSIVPGTVTLNGVPVGTGDSLQDAVGLSMSSDGTVFGRPLRTGLVTIHAHAVDAKKRIALDRTNSTPDQFLQFNIGDSSVTTTDSTILAVSVKGDTSLFNTDTVAFSAFMNLSGVNTTTLRGKSFAFFIGGSTFEGFLSQAGAIVNIHGGQLIFPDGTLMTGIVDSVNGTVKGKLTRASLTNSLNATGLVNRSFVRYGIGLIIAEQLIATDTVEFSAKHVGNKYTLDYSIGKIGAPMGGGFQIFDVRGSDGLDIAGNQGDAWITKFLISPRYGIDDTAGFDNLHDITVRIGSNFTQVLPVYDKVNSPNTPGVTSKNGSIVLAGPVFGASVSQLRHQRQLVLTAS